MRNPLSEFEKPGGGTPGTWTCEYSSQKSVGRANSAARVGGRVGRTMDESVINFKNVSCGGGFSSSNPYSLLTPPIHHTPLHQTSTLPLPHPPTIETVSDHAAAGSWRICVWRLHVVVGVRDRRGEPASQFVRTFRNSQTCAHRSSS